MTTYANQKLLLLNNLLTRTPTPIQVPVSPGAGTISTALAGITDATVNKRYALILADGDYTETAALDLHTKNYIDLIGSAYGACKITNATAGQDVIQAGGADALIQGIWLNQSASSSSAYALYLNSSSSAAALTIINACKLTSDTKAGCGIGVRYNHVIAIIDSILTSTASQGLIANSTTNDPTGGKIALVGCTVTGPEAGLYYVSNGNKGVPELILSGNTLTCTTNGWADLRITGSRALLVGGGTIPDSSPSITWDGSGSGRQVLAQGVYKTQDWSCSTYQSGKYWTLYHNGTNWILYASTDINNAKNPVGFAGADYFYCGTNLWNGPTNVLMSAAGAYSPADAPYLALNRVKSSSLGWGDEYVVWLDSTSGGTNTLTNTAGSQTSLTAKKGTCYLNAERIVTKPNVLLQMLAWLTSDIDPRSDIVAVGSVLAATPRWTGATGADVGTRVDCPANKALTTSGNYGDPASPTVGTNVLPAVTDVRAGVSVGVSPAVGTLDVAADNPPYPNKIGI